MTHRSPGRTGRPLPHSPQYLLPPSLSFTTLPSFLPSRSSPLMCYFPFSVLAVGLVGHLGSFYLFSLTPSELAGIFFPLGLTLSWIKFSESLKTRPFLILEHLSIIFSYRHRECLRLYPALLCLPTWHCRDSEYSEMGFVSCKSGVKCHRVAISLSLDKFLISEPSLTHLQMSIIATIPQLNITLQIYTL